MPTVGYMYFHRRTARWFYYAIRLLLGWRWCQMDAVVTEGSEIPARAWPKVQQNSCSNHRHRSHNLAAWFTGYLLTVYLFTGYLLNYLFDHFQPRSKRTCYIHSHRCIYNCQFACYNIVGYTRLLLFLRSLLHSPKIQFLYSWLIMPLKHLTYHSFINSLSGWHKAPGFACRRDRNQQDGNRVQLPERPEQGHQHPAQHQLLKSYNFARRAAQFGSKRREANEGHVRAAFRQTPYRLPRRHEHASGP